MGSGRPPVSIFQLPPLRYISNKCEVVNGTYYFHLDDSRLFIIWIFDRETTPNWIELNNEQNRIMALGNELMPGIVIA